MPLPIPLNAQRAETFASRLALFAVSTPAAPALLGSGRVHLSYGRLWEHIQGVAHALKAAGIRRTDRIALALPDGPEMAAAFLATSAWATCAPLNPAYRADECRFYLADLQAKLLIAPSDQESAAVSVAREMGIPVVALSAALQEPAGIFHLDGEMNHELASEAAIDLAGQDEVALVLHTSGTTSRPKLVALTHGNLAASARHIAEVLRLTSRDCCLNVMPLFHIHGLSAGLLASLSSGGSVACTAGFQAPAFFDWLEEFAPSWYTAVPSMQRSILARAERHRETIARRPLRFIRSSSASLAPGLMQDLEAAFQAPVIESYGMTEAAHQIASNPLPPFERKPGTVGMAAGPEIAVMDAIGVLLGAGQTGEIVVRGANVTRGYEANPEANDPANAAANDDAFSGGWFRTGDQGYLDVEGYLTISGRLKELINRGGEKISPREVDEVLLAHPAVAQAVTFAIPDARLGEDVGAVVVIEPGAVVTETELREFAAERLAAFKVPRRVLFRDEIAAGPTGKPQRIGLAERLGIVTSEAAPAEFAEPRDADEIAIARIWQAVLRVPRVGIHDDFLALGGDSILAAQIVSRTVDALPCRLSLVHFLNHPTVARLAASLAPSLAPSVERTAAAIPVRIQPRDGPLPLSPAQRRLWFLDRLNPGTAAYNRPVLLRLTGPLNPSALAQALSAIVQRHEPLRSVFGSRDGLPWQSILPAVPVSLAHVAADALEDEARRPFNLERGPLFRAALAELSEREHLLLISTHHIVFDDWSERVLLGELAAFYSQFTGRGDAVLPVLALQFADLASIEEDCGASIEVWRARLAGADMAELHPDFPRPPVQTFTGRRITRNLPAALGPELKNFSRQQGVTFFTTLLAAFQALLARHTGETDISVGTPVHGRTRTEAEPLVGVFVNTLVLRTSLSDDPPVRELLARTRETVLEALTHQDASFALVVEAVETRRDLSRSPLFQVLFQLRDVNDRHADLPGLRLETLAIDIGVAKFDLSVEVVDRGGELACVAEYNSGLFAPATVEHLLAHFQRLLEGIVIDPERRISELRILDESERRTVLVEWNRTQPPQPLVPPSQRLHHFFEAQAARTPLAIAAVFGGESVSYAALNARADELASRLRDLGVAADCPVGISIERSVDMAVAVLAVLKAGGACVPLDPHFPPQRLSLMVEDAGVQLILRHGSMPTERVAAGGFSAPHDPLAYLIFTSGSTGRPKAVAMSHAPLCNLIAWQVRNPGFAEGRKTLQFVSLSFDVAFQEIFSTWASGGTLVLIPDDLPRDLPGLWRFIERESIERLFLPFVALRGFAEVAQAERRYPPSLREVIAAGEQLQITAPVRHLFEQLPDCTLENQYGPAESHVVTAHTLSRSVVAWPALPPIGRPIANARIYVLDVAGEPVPIGVPGELYIGGPVLARGYQNQPALTAERFLDDPFVPGSPMYRTGDRVRHSPTGDIEFLGRMDRQMKIRGYRVEAGEIEIALGRHPAVGAAWVAEGPGMKLIAYVTLREHSPCPSHEEWVDFLRQSLPEPMIPAAFVRLERIPLLPSGKVDRRALPEPEPRQGPVAFSAPETELEAEIAAIWESVLAVNRVGMDDNFFDLGGHSLALAQVHARLQQRHQGALSIVDMFRHSTVRSLARHLLQPGAGPAITSVEDRARKQREAFQRQRQERE